ncbi:Rpn family recombination-promoting nuclease/putative transposase [Planktothrix mougeotii]|uniref:Rpn family recombination-promoting nuclease/putative transposase n=1 Tax=Planktothrix mougeotii LEGE 06226 TaxID=1828728 RepID=A0ABR9UIR9_9CYAN|nr:Rpn family recombination-promoting nuclease/putative transposase [Planktothrix mougeotii]MBE9146363.1 Rpn family recombination-promoting nuclease/putative transposase [Planktothrix mougeotii LEGE 06226]
MRFINPKTDFAFKKIFGSEDSKDILISFLNSILYPDNPQIEDLTILNPYQAPKIRGIKDTYLDVKATITGNKTVIIEMQILNIEGFEKRILYNAAKAYSIQLKSGEDYTLLNPVIAVTITDFEMFPHLDKVISRFVLKEKEFLVDYLIYDIELVFVELPKFNTSIHELETLTDKWIYFIKSAKTLETVPQTMAQIPELQKAFTIANETTLTPEELEDLEKREIYIYDQRNAIKKAVKLAREEALKQGIEQGIEQGKEESKLEIAQQLIGLLDDQTISQTTGLSIEQIQQLRQKQETPS